MRTWYEDRVALPFRSVKRDLGTFGAGRQFDLFFVRYKQRIRTYGGDLESLVCVRSELAHKWQMGLG